jgi:SRSO17 transposase
MNPLRGDESMERRFRIRLEELLDDARVRPGLLTGVMDRLESFLDPFVASLESAERRTNAQQYVQGLLSDLDGKDIESIAYLHDRDRQGLQKFIGQVEWNHRPLVTELARQIGAELGEPDGVLVFDPSAFAKKGAESVGVQRQWCGRLGKIENCQVGVYLGYVSRVEHALVDCRLFLPKEWAKRKRRCADAGVPKDIGFKTRHELMLEMLDEHQAVLPHGWIAGDDELGRSSWFRQELQRRNERYLLAVPSNTLVRDLKAPEPPSTNGGRRRRAPFQRVEHWCAALPASAWHTIEVRAGEKGPLAVQATWTLVQARTEGRASDMPEVLVVFREQQANGAWKHDYLLSNGWMSDGLSIAPLEEYARVLKAQHRIEECLKRAKSEAGLADYQVRTWVGWHHHQVLAMLATWFLTRETRRGKNPDTRADGAAGAGDDWATAEWDFETRQSRADSPQDGAPIGAERESAAIPLETPQPFTASAV